MASIQQAHSIDWLETKTIFEDPTQMLFVDAPQMVEHEISTMINQNYFQEIFKSLDNFSLNSYSYYFTNVEIPGDVEQPALVKDWRGKNGERMQYWVTADEDTDDHGWGVIYDGVSTFVVVGNYNDHPFVLTKDIYFYNTDGSTHEQMDFPSFGMEHIAHWTKSKLNDYIFNQIH